MTVPAQSARPPDAPRTDAPLPRPSGPYAPTEATRRLCAGAYLESRFPRRAVEELVGHDSRVVAPAAGVDVVSVLTHALRARKLERRTGLGIAFLWVLFVLADLHEEPFAFMAPYSLSAAYDQNVASARSYLPMANLTLDMDFAKDIPGYGSWALNYAVVCGLLWLAGRTSGLRSGVYRLDGLGPRRRGAVLRNVLGPGLLMVAYWVIAVIAVWNSSAEWMAVVFPLLLSVPVWAHRRAVESVLRHRLGKEVFESRPRDEPAGPSWLCEIGRAIEREQHSKLILYDPDRPFAGLGTALEPWSLVMDLRRKPGVDARPLTATEVLDRLRERLSGLSRLPADSAGLDRLGAVEIDELVYLPSGPPRSEVDRGETAVRTHLREAVGEGGEGRRHYLRAQVSAWEDELVVCVLVRVHSQGELLVVEAMPFVQGPMRPEYGLVDAVIERSGGAFPMSSLARAFLTAPAGGAAALVSLVGSAADAALHLTRRYRRAKAPEAPSEGPAVSVRDLAAADKVSEFQWMDAGRYLKSIEARVATAVLQVVKEKGYDTGELEQQVIQVSSGGVFVGAMSGGAVATGRGASARGAGPGGARALRGMVTRRPGR